MSGTASALVAPGAIVAGKYRLDAVIGEGGMGAVWAATHTGLGQAVAVKFISKEFITSPEALRRFDSEAKAAAQLRSRHVVQVFDNGTLEDGTPYIAMELLRGENVHARVHRAGPVPLNEAVEILSQCCRALTRAHAAGIVHRDIKPDNIFLTQTEEEGILVKVLDFGIAKFASGPNDHSSTRTGAVLGTPLYMSPEQARGLKTIDYRTDLYSLGLVAYTMLTGNLAFSSESFGDLLVQICTAPLPSLCANAPWLPAAMEPWFQRACARDPSARFVSAQELTDALRAAAGVGRASALPESAVQGMPPGGIAMGNVAHAASIGTASGMSRTGDPSALPVLPKNRGALVAVAALLVLGAIGLATVLTFTRKEHRPEGVATAAALAPPAPPPAAASATASAAATLAEEPKSPPPPSAASADVAAPGSPGPARSGAPASSHATSARVVNPPAPPASAPPRIAGPKPIDLGY